MFNGTQTRCDEAAGYFSWSSLAYIMMPKLNCRILDLQTARLAVSFDLAKAGNSIAAKIAIIAITTNSSIKVNAIRGAKREDFVFNGIFFMGSSNVKPAKTHRPSSEAMRGS